MNKLIVRKAAVLGAGVMGAQIAAHLANAGVPVVLFDLPAKEGAKNGIVNKALDGLKKLDPAPLANRMTHAELLPDVKAWSAWASKASISPTLIGFLNFRSELLHTFDPQKPTTVFATPRTWKFANEDFMDATMPADVKTASIAGSVGEGPAIELGAFVEIMNSIRPIEEIVAQIDAVTHDDLLRVAAASFVRARLNLAVIGPFDGEARFKNLLAGS